MTNEPNGPQAQASRGVTAHPDGELFAPTPAEQRTARTMGAWFLGTFVFSIPAFFFYEPILNGADHVVGSGEHTRIGMGALLEILLAI